MPSPAQLRAAIGRAVIKDNPVEATRLRAEYYTTILAAKIKETVDKAPPLTAEQIERLRGLLPVPTGRDEAGAA